MKAPRVDVNHREIVQALAYVGATVQSLASIGKGCPDILVGYRGKNWILEIKTPTGCVNDYQAKWARDWRGQSAVVRSVAEALKIIGAA